MKVTKSILQPGMVYRVVNFIEQEFDGMVNDCVVIKSKNGKEKIPLRGLMSLTKRKGGWSLREEGSTHFSLPTKFKYLGDGKIE
jgi:hypothetical protein